MAYERTWQFMSVQGPIIPPAAPTDSVYTAFYLKSLMCNTGNVIPGYTAGAWTVVGSSDGTAGNGAMDGVDRWGTVTGANVVSSGGGVAHSWCVLQSPVTPNGTRLYLVIDMCAFSANGGAGGTIALSWSMTLPTGGSYTTVPTFTTMGGTHGASQNLTLYAGNADATNPRRYYGGLTTTGDFWFASTLQGKSPFVVMAMVPVGYKGNDQYPWYYKVFNANGASNILNNSTLMAPDPAPQTNRTRSYAGATLWCQFLIAPPTYSTSAVLLDAADTSLWDFPAWVMVGNATSLSITTSIHARGRLPDVGLTACQNADKDPVTTGNVIRDAGSNIRYVTCGQALLPYNAAMV